MLISSDLATPQNVFIYSITFLIFYILCRAIYNITLHPLAHIPGPKLAGATYLYQTYFTFAGGKSVFYLQIEKLHKQYGPVIRTTPDEVHLSDPDNYETIQRVGTKYAKAPKFYNSFSVGYSTFTAASNELHKVRRAALNPFFSRKMVLRLEDVVQDKAEKLCSLVTRNFALGKAVDLHHAFRAISVDVITDYAFNSCYDLLDKPDLGRDFFSMVRGVGPAMWAFQQFPQLQSLALALPDKVAAVLNPAIGKLLELKSKAYSAVLATKKDIDSGVVRADSRPTIFYELLNPSDKSGDQRIPSPENITDEAYVILAAAADTTGNAMSIAAYGVINNPEISKTLAAELKEAFPGPSQRLDFVQLEKLPFLSAVIKEGLRLSYGVIGRLPRIVPEPGADFNGVHVPAGSTVSMSAWMLHRNTDYFPDPDKFDPSRWLSRQEAKRLEKAFAPFGKGTRQCVGMPLAYCELYVSLGTFFRRFEDLQSNELTGYDRTYDDYFSPYHPVDANLLHIYPKA